LLSPSADHKELSWARQWLEELDLPLDPFELTSIACKWMDQCIALQETLERIEIRKA
jgi:hypothetical protein